MLLREIVDTSTAVAATSGRRAKVELLAACLRRVGLGEAGAAVAFLAGEPRQRPLGVGYASLRDLPAPAVRAALRAGQVDEAFERLSRLAGPGSASRRRELLMGLLARATAAEQRWLCHLVTGELRQGALEAIVVEAIARAAALPLTAVRRALMLCGALDAVAEVALRDGEAGLSAFRLVLGRPVQPLLAQSARDVETALERVSPAGIEWKLDGARIQIHRDGDEIAVFTRSLDEITPRVPEVVEAVRGLTARAVVLDGEVLALDAGRRPLPFQVTAARVAARRGVERLRAATPLTPFLFDVLHLDGEDLIDAGGASRHAALASAVPAALRTPRIVTDGAEEAEAFLQAALSAGHEGVMVKSLDAPYEAGRRGRGWIKVKPHHTLDLVILAAEWGHGRRQGWLSNLHLGARLGARDHERNGFVMLGKTFKGLTDEMLAWQTTRLLALESARDEWTVRVRPELVVEIAFDGVQTSPRYPGGVALRFARVVRHRPDKRAADADTLATILAIHAGT